MMSTSMPRRSSAARMRAAAALAKALSSGWATTPQKDQVCACQEPREKACEAWEHSLGFDPRRDQAGGRPRRAQTAQGCNDRRHHEGDWLAAALGPRLLCGCGAQETRLNADIGEGLRRTRLSCDCQTAVQIEAEDLRTIGRLAMAGMDTPALEGEIDRIRSLGLEELRREWRRLYHSEPPRISRDLLVLALGYRLQEIEHGGLGKSTRRKLQTMAKALRRRKPVIIIQRWQHRPALVLLGCDEGGAGFTHCSLLLGKPLAGMFAPAAPFMPTTVCCRLPRKGCSI